VDVEQNVLSSRAECPHSPGDGSSTLLQSVPTVFSLQLILGDTLDTENVKAAYNLGVLTLRIPAHHPHGQGRE